MKKVWILGMSFAGFVASVSHAGSMGPVHADWSWIAAVSGGPVWENAGTSQTLFLNPGMEKAYAPNQSTTTLGDFELLGGMQHAVGSKWIGQLGLAVAATTDAKLSGEIWDDAEPEFNNYVYQYKIQHTHIAVKGKLLADMGYWVMPWVSASVGVGFNTAHGFTNTPTIFEAATTPNFRQHTSTVFTYTAGAGIQRALNEHWSVGAGYEFADWGRSQLSRAAGQALNSGLKLNHLYTNGVMFNVTYVS